MIDEAVDEEAEFMVFQTQALVPSMDGLLC
jgi:hypothetical protein